MTTPTFYSICVCVCCTKESESVAKQHRWAQVVDEVQVREGPSDTVILEKPERTQAACQHRAKHTCGCLECQRTKRTRLSEMSVAKAASLALMLQDRAEPSLLFRRACMAMILQTLRTGGGRRGFGFFFFDQVNQRSGGKRRIERVRL